ncbi:hypothetical protein B5X24_HaOG205256 [Helicoverpa armigera]|uniref:Uncharacterized protein n=1 Tax=Helicoverpa armigera TaxID=29058 RepID=A0A2W1BQW7_HELAM|nr:hypothetical protein B5X24_HaOG205256 [Helicoverpa armigera]
MSCVKQDAGTSTQHSDFFRFQHESVEERYKKCGLLNIILHIDICGKYKSTYNEQTRGKIRSNECDVKMSTISSAAKTPADIIKKTVSISEQSVVNIDSKLSRFSITTKVSGLYPGHDILMNRSKNLMNRSKKKPSTKQLVISAFVPR